MTSTITQRIGGAVAGVPVNTGAGGIIQATDVTGTNDYVAETSPGISQYFPNQFFTIRIGITNTGATTLDFGPGELPWRTPSGAEHAAGALSPDLEYLVKLNEAMTEFRTFAPF